VSPQTTAAVAPGSRPWSRACSVDSADRRSRVLSVRLECDARASDNDSPWASNGKWRSTVTIRATVDALERIVFAAVALTTRALSEARGDLDLTLAQWRVLVVLGETEDGATISQVAGRIGVTLPATSRQLRRLERRGLVDVSRDQRDRRATRVRLTRLGRSARDDVVSFRRRKIAQIAASLNLDPAMATELARIADALDLR
jgi:DNA-binding MarR family transcriptional regulator